jgi:hypothetical protein
MNKDIIKEKIDFYLNTKEKVHITKENKNFLNGVIYGKLTDEIYLFKDAVSGNTKLFLKEVFDIEEYRERTQ